tara:strand:- start:14447 stop:15094 length:648 start_codon:yes stop_codon:yes gene_type:complete
MGYKSLPQKLNESRHTYKKILNEQGVPDEPDGEFWTCANDDGSCVAVNPNNVSPDIPLFSSPEECEAYSLAGLNCGGTDFGPGGCPHPEATNYNPGNSPTGNPVDCSGQPLGPVGQGDITCCEWPMMTCYKCSGINKPTLAVTTQQFPQFNNWGIEKSCEDNGNEWSEEVPDCDKGSGVSTLAPQKNKSKKAKRPTPQRDKKLREELKNFKRLIK